MRRDIFFFYIQENSVFYKIIGYSDWSLDLDLDVFGCFIEKLTELSKTLLNIVIKYQL